SHCAARFCCGALFSVFFTCLLFFFPFPAIVLSLHNMFIERLRHCLFEFLDCNRLHHVPVRAELQCFIHHHIRGFRGKHDDRQVLPFLAAAQELEHVQPGHFGHVDVEDQQVGTFARQQSLRRGARVGESLRDVIQQLEHQTNRFAHLLVIVNDPDFFHSKFAFTLCAADSFMPFTAAISSTLASLILSTEPKCFKSAFRLVGPIPGMESNWEARPSFERFFRCAVIPKRCASSRILCTRYSPCEWRGNISGSLLCGKKISSSCLASPTTG